MKIDVIMYSFIIVLISVVGVAAYSLHINQIRIGYALAGIGLALFFVGFLLSMYLEKNAVANNGEKDNRIKVN